MFEGTLSPESSRRASARKSRFFPAAVVVHGALLLAVLGASLWSVEEPPDPPVPIAWVSTAPPASPPSVRSGHRPRVAGARRRREVVAPSVVPDRLPVAAALPEPAEAAAVEEKGEEISGAADGGAGSTEGGSGIPGGWGPGGVGPGVEGRDGILVPGGDVHAPVLVRRIEPIYPEGARKARLEGDVVLEAIITSRGEIEEVRIVKSAGPLFDASATAAVSSWKYRPATLNGRAVRVLLTVTISFRLH